MKRFIRRLVRQFGYDVTRARESPTVAQFLESRRIDTVLDVGANTGQFAEHIRGMGYGGEIVSFEPIESNFRVLESKARQDPRWRAKRLALGDTCGSATIHVSKLSLYSSLLPLSSVATALDPRAAVERLEDVHVVRLDDIYFVVSVVTQRPAARPGLVPVLS